MVTNDTCSDTIPCPGRNCKHCACGKGKEKSSTLDEDLKTSKTTKWTPFSEIIDKSVNPYQMPEFGGNG